MSFYSALREGNWLNHRRLVAYPRIFLIMYVVLGIAWVAGLHTILKPDEGVLVTDYVSVYAAGLVSHTDNPAKAYDWSAHQALEEHIKQDLNHGNSFKYSGIIPWLYPPLFLALAWLVACLPYFTSLIVYSIVGLGAFALTLRKFLPPYKEAYWALAAFSGVFINLFSGQNGFITTALLGAGLFLLRDYPLVAGLFFGLLSYKPQFFLLVPLVLFVGRYWKALFATTLSAVFYAALSLIVFGMDSWQAFFKGLSVTRSAILENDNDRWLGILHSVFSMVRILGGSLSAAYFMQMLVAALAILALIWIWGRRNTSFAVRGSALVAALLLVSPYSFVYDQVLLAIPIALLATEGLKKGFLPFEKTYLFALWLLPFLVQDTGSHFSLPLSPPMLVALMYFCMMRSKSERLSSG